MITANTGVANGFAFTINDVPGGVRRSHHRRHGHAHARCCRTRNLGTVSLNSGNLVLGSATATVGAAGNNLAAFGGTISATAALTIADPIQLKSGAGYVTFTGAGNILLNQIISGVGSLAVNMSNSTTALAYSTAANTYSGITNVMEGTLAISSPGDSAFNVGGLAGEGDLLLIGNGQAGTQASVIDSNNSLPNDTTTIINNTGTFTVDPATADADGWFPA